MKNLMIGILLIFLGASISSCAGNRCGGSGWYGNRNLTLNQEKTHKQIPSITVITKEMEFEDCD